jgi:hypothetical protein
VAPSIQHDHLDLMLSRSASMATIGSIGWAHFLVPYSPWVSIVCSSSSSTSLSTRALTAMAVKKSTTKTVARRPNTMTASTQVRQIATSHTGQHTDSVARGHGATDGTSDEMDFASRIRTAKHGPHHNVALDHNQTESTAMSEPMAAFHQGHDGHHSQVTSDRSYRSGPSVESGSS